MSIPLELTFWVLPRVFLPYWFMSYIMHYRSRSKAKNNIELENRVKKNGNKEFVLLTRKRFTKMCPRLVLNWNGFDNTIPSLYLVHHHAMHGHQLVNIHVCHLANCISYIVRCYNTWMYGILYVKPMTLCGFIHHPL